MAEEQTTQHFVIKLITTGGKPFPKERIEDAIRIHIMRYDLGPQIVEMEIHEEGSPGLWVSTGEVDG